MKSRARQLSQFLRLRSADRQTLVAAVICLPVVWLGLRFMGLPRMQAMVQPIERPGCNSIPLEEMRALAALVDIASRHTVGPVTCLTRSLLLIWLLRRRGVHSQLCIGVRLAAGELAAHAWVEAGKSPVNDRPDIGSHFLPFGELIPLRAFRSP